MRVHAPSPTRGATGARTPASMRHKAVRHPCAIPVCRRHVGSNERSQPGAGHVWRRQQQTVPPIPRLCQRTHCERRPDVANTTSTSSQDKACRQICRRATCPRALAYHAVKVAENYDGRNDKVKERNADPGKCFVRPCGEAIRSTTGARFLCGLSARYARAHAHAHTVSSQTQARQYDVRDRARGWEGAGRAGVGGARTHLPGQQKQQFATRPRRQRRHQS